MDKVFGEKFIKKEIRGNRVIRINVFREFDFDYEEICRYVDAYITDCPEEQARTYGIYCGYDEYFSVDADECCTGLTDRLKVLVVENSEGEEHNLEIIERFIEKVKEAVGFTIYLQKTRKDYAFDGVVSHV